MDIAYVLTATRSARKSLDLDAPVADNLIVSSSKSIRDNVRYWTEAQSLKQAVEDM